MTISFIKILVVLMSIVIFIMIGFLTYGLFQKKSHVLKQSINHIIKEPVPSIFGNLYIDMSEKENLVQFNRYKNELTLHINSKNTSRIIILSLNNKNIIWNIILNNQ